MFFGEGHGRLLIPILSLLPKYVWNCPARLKLNFRSRWHYETLVIDGKVMYLKWIHQSMLNIIVLEVPKYESLCLSAMAFLTRTASDPQILKNEMISSFGLRWRFGQGNLGRDWVKYLWIKLNRQIEQYFDKEFFLNQDLIFELKYKEGRLRPFLRYQSLKLIIDTWGAREFGQKNCNLRSGLNKISGALNFEFPIMIFSPSGSWYSRCWSSAVSSLPVTEEI